MRETGQRRRRGIDRRPDEQGRAEIDDEGAVACAVAHLRLPDQGGGEARVQDGLQQLHRQHRQQHHPEVPVWHNPRDHQEQQKGDQPVGEDAEVGPERRARDLSGDLEACHLSRLPARVGTRPSRVLPGHEPPGREGAAARRWSRAPPGWRRPRDPGRRSARPAASGADRNPRS